MKKTSRRRFGKQLTAALAALPVSSVVMATRPPVEQKALIQKDPIKKKNEHNTPPPLYFQEGSLIIEAFTMRDDWSANDHDPVNHRRKWSIVPKPYAHLPGMPPTNLYIEHVKVVDGAGEMVHRTDNDADKDPIKIMLTLKKGEAVFGDCEVTVEGDHYVIVIPDTKRIKKKSGDPPSNSRRKRVRYMHQSGSDADECEWVGLKIEKGGKVDYVEDNLPLHLDGYKEMRLMIWWTNFPPA